MLSVVEEPGQCQIKPTGDLLKAQKVVFVEWVLGTWCCHCLKVTSVQGVLCKSKVTKWTVCFRMCSNPIQVRKTHKPRLVEKVEKTSHKLVLSLLLLMHTVIAAVEDGLARPLSDLVGMFLEVTC